MLHARIRRIEAVLQRRASPKTPSGPVVVWTATTCVKALRILLGQLARPADAVLSDPFPDLEGEDYLLAFWPWLLANDEPWPRWARAYAHHVGAMALGNAGRIPLRGLPDGSSCRVQTSQDVIDLLQEQVEAVRAEDLAGTVEKARAIGCLVGHARKAIETGQVAARIEMLEMVLKQRQRDGSS